MRALLHQLLEHLGVLFQGPLLFLNLASQLAYLNGSMQGSHEVNTIDGLFDEIVSAITKRLDNKRLIGVTGDEQGGYIWS
jgi:hypothetical protein